MLTRTWPPGANPCLPILSTPRSQGYLNLPGSPNGIGAKRDNYALGPDVPDTETLRDSAGRVVDDEHAGESRSDWVRDVLHEAARRAS